MMHLLTSMHFTMIFLMYLKRKSQASIGTFRKIRFNKSKDEKKLLIYERNAGAPHGIMFDALQRIRVR